MYSGDEYTVSVTSGQPAQRGTHITVQHADMIRRIREIDPDKLDLLADWFDADDAAKGGNRGDGVQADLRRWARILRAVTL